MNFKRNAVFVNVLWAWGMIALLFMASCKIGQKDENKEKNMEAWTMADGFSVDGREIVDDDWAESGYELRYAKDGKRFDYLAAEDSSRFLHSEVVPFEKEFVFLDSFLTGEEINYYLSALEDPTKAVKIELAEYLGENGVIQSFTAGYDELLLGVSHSYDQTKGTFQKYTVLGLKKDGSFSWKRELTDFFEQNKIGKDQMTAWRILGRDEAKNLYLSYYDAGLYVLSEEGQSIFREPASRDKASSFDAFRKDDGEIILWHYESGNGELFQVNKDDGRKETLLDHDIGDVVRWYGMHENMVFYASSEGLVKWNVEAGERKRILSFEEAGVHEPPLAVLANEEGVSLFFRENEKQFLLQYVKKDSGTLQANETQTEGHKVSEEGQNNGTENSSENQPGVSICVSNLCGEIKPLKGCIADYDRMTPEISVSYRTVKEDARDRELLDFVVGDGADILIVSRKDFRSLVEQECVAELSEMLDADLLSKILPGALEMGTVNDRLCGLPFAIERIHTLIVNRGLWDKGDWTPEDVLEIVTAHPELQGIFLDLFGMDDAYHSLFLWVGQSLGDSAFLKDKNGFESEVFRKILETIKERSRGNRQEDLFECVKNREYLGAQMQIYDVLNFCTIYKRAGEDASCIGVPNENGNGNYLIELGGLLVVNKEAMAKKEVKELVCFLFGEDGQMKVEEADNMMSVRYDIPEAYIKSGRAPSIKINDRMENGSSYLKEYTEFLKSATVKSDLSEQLFEIVWEEAEAYFMGDKTLDETTAVIQKRVNLLMAE
ncbi:MAG: carbohydrate ABC transporter substrate-binding protein [Lachnospiraceae bacterium]|nr:carbohydrate ABC transporter substrate-binding protein [Lachnospiraceae bacterium]